MDQLFGAQSAELMAKVSQQQNVPLKLERAEEQKQLGNAAFARGVEAASAAAKAAKAAAAASSSTNAADAAPATDVVAAAGAEEAAGAAGAAPSAAKKDEFALALFHYNSAVLHVKGLQGLTPEQQTQHVDPLLVACHNNMAACQLRQKRWARAEKSAAAVLEVAGHANNAKALFRRGKARSMLGHLEGARADLEAALKANPSDSMVKRELALLARKEKAAEAKSAAFMRGMFAASAAAAKNEADDEDARPAASANNNNDDGDDEKKKGGDR